MLAALLQKVTSKNGAQLEGGPIQRLVVVPFRPGCLLGFQLEGGPISLGSYLDSTGRFNGEVV